MRPNANTTWFNFTAQSGNFEVYALSGVEQVHKPYEFALELVSRSPNVDVAGLLGTPADLSIQDMSGGTRHVNGLIRDMEQLHTANRFTHYRAIIVPRLWFLGQITDHRIFQNMSVVEIIQKILKEQGFDSNASSFKLFYSYEPREYCVQYGETYLHFISRLCEEEGIYFYFEHSQGSHCLCFCDREGGPPIGGEALLRYCQGTGQVADTATVNRLQLHHKVNSNAVAYRDWNFTKPKLDLNLEEKSDPAIAPVPAGMNLEQYQYPHLYQLRAEGARYAKLQSTRQLNFSRWIEISSNVSRFLPSYTFGIYNHDRNDINAKWWIFSVQHQGSQPAVLEDEAPDTRGQHYQSSVIAIPEMTRYIPELAHAKNRIIGQQTAIVTGPEGEEIYPDQFGRVKVQFFWDREGQWDEKTTCWIRVSQGWAGGQYGAMAIPRIGHEVVVSFLEGDPDRPLITGRVYHALNMPPYSLPEHKTRMTIRSKTQHGDGYNELRFEDMKGNEQIFIHGQRDQDIIIENDSREWIKGHEYLLVEKDSVEEIKGTSSSQAGKDRMEATAEKRTVTVGGDEAHQIGGSCHLKVSNNIFMEGMTNGVIEMHKELTLKAPGGFIHIDGTGVTIEGKVVNINTGGAAGTGFPVQAVPARAAARADSREAGSGHTSQAALTTQPQVIRSESSEAAPLTSFGGNNFAAETIPGAGIHSMPDAIPSAFAGMAVPALSLMRNAPSEVAQLKISETPIAAEWRKTVLDASQETSVSGKMEIVNNFLQKNVALSSKVSEVPQAPATLLQSGQGSSLECATAKYYTLAEAGVPADSMSVVTTNQGTVLAVCDGSQTLVASSEFTPGVPMILDTASMAPDVQPLMGFGSNSLCSYTPV